MSYHYIDETRASDPHAQPDVEFFCVLTVKDWKDPLDCFRCSDWANDEDNTPHSEHVGWYYAHGFPGSLWDSDPIGPFDTEAEALTEGRVDSFRRKQALLIRGICAAFLGGAAVGAVVASVAGGL